MAKKHTINFLCDLMIPGVVQHLDRTLHVKGNKLVFGDGTVFYDDRQSKSYEDQVEQCMKNYKNLLKKKLDRK